MNDGVTVCTNVFRSVLDWLQSSYKLNALSDKEMLELLEPYGKILATYLAGLSSDERKGFRSLRGNEGQRTGTRECQRAIHLKMPEFDPPGLKEWIEEQKSGANVEAVKCTADGSTS